MLPAAGNPPFYTKYIHKKYQMNNFLIVIKDDNSAGKNIANGLSKIKVRHHIAELYVHCI